MLQPDGFLYSPGIMGYTDSLQKYVVIRIDLAAPICYSIRCEDRFPSWVSVPRKRWQQGQNWILVDGETGTRFDAVERRPGTSPGKTEKHKRKLRGVGL